MADDVLRESYDAVISAIQRDDEDKPDSEERLTIAARKYRNVFTK